MAGIEQRVYGRGAGVLSGYFLYRYYAGQKRWEARLSTPFLIWGLLWWFGNGFAELDYHVSDDYVLASIIAFIAGSAAALGWLERLTGRF